jgi:type II secretory pathway component PulF
MFSSLTYLEKLFFTKHLSMFLKAGIPLDEALETLAEEDEKSSVSRIARSIREQIENGQPLHKALAEEPRSFDLFFVSMVEIGEVSGTLEKSLDFLATKITREAALRKKIKGMLYYPAVVVTASCAIGAFISFFVLPKLSSMFKSFDVKLPLATRMLLFLAEGVKKYGLIIVILFIGIIILFRLFLSVWPNFRFFWHKSKLRLPIVGKIIKNAALTAFFRNLGIMLSSGLSLEYALRIESEISENLVLRRAAADMHKIISQGKRIGEELRSQDSTVFPPLASRMILVGEMSGKLEESLMYLADFFEDETEVQAKNAAAVLEPVLLLTIGIIVAFVALAVILPIYSLTGSINH